MPVEWEAGPPLKEDAIIYHLGSGALCLAEGFLRKADDLRLAPIIAGDTILPLRWLPSATPLWTCCPESPYTVSWFCLTSFTKYGYTFSMRKRIMELAKNRI